MQTPTSIATAINLDAANAELAELTAEERLRWGERHFGADMALLGSMQKTSCVLTHLLASVNRDREVVFVDTGFHFHETLQLRDRLVRKYRVDVMTLYPDETPEQQEERFGRKLHLFVDGQPECCRLRKEEPFLNYVRESGKKLIVNGVRRSEGGRRKQLKFVMPDPRIDGYILHPLLDWTDESLAECRSIRSMNRIIRASDASAAPRRSGREKTRAPAVGDTCGPATNNRPIAGSISPMAAASDGAGFRGQVLGSRF
jgi:phosphoadenosine phosphosulfate reductase